MLVDAKNSVPTTSTIAIRELGEVIQEWAEVSKNMFSNNPGKRLGTRGHEAYRSKSTHGGRRF